MAQPADIEKLLALKAFYMGHAIAEKPALREQALHLVGKAIEHFRQAASDDDRTRLAFYVLLRAEVLRVGGSPLPDRAWAKAICDDLGSPLYDHFMAVEQATQTTKRLEGIQSLKVVDDGVRRTESHEGTDGLRTWLVRYDRAARALGVHLAALPESQQRFLKQVTLLELLDRHHVPH